MGVAAAALAAVLSPTTLGAPVTTPTTDPGRGRSSSSAPPTRAPGARPSCPATASSTAAWAANRPGRRWRVLRPMWWRRGRTPCSSGATSTTSAAFRPSRWKLPGRPRASTTWACCGRRARRTSRCCWRRRSPLPSLPICWIRVRAFVGRLRGKQSYAARVNAQVRELNTFRARPGGPREVALAGFRAGVRSRWRRPQAGVRQGRPQPHHAGWIRRPDRLHARSASAAALAILPGPGGRRGRHVERRIRASHRQRRR